MNFFKKLEPRQKVILDNNQSVEFSTLDGITGYFATEVEYVTSQLRTRIAQQRDAVFEISADEFVRDYVEVKKNPQRKPLKPVWREEIGAGVLHNTTAIAQIGADKVQSVAAVRTTVETPPPAPTEQLKTNLGKRKR